MGRRPEIPQTKRSMYRPMNQMNGDYLTQLKKPVCSELTPDFRGGMRARDEQCRQQIDLWYKDQEYTLRKINRSEDNVYGTLVSVHKEKRRLQRKAHREMQEEARRQSLNSMSSGRNSNSSKVPVLPKIPPRVLTIKHGDANVDSQQTVSHFDRRHSLSPRDIKIDMVNGESRKQSIDPNGKEKSDSDMKTDSARGGKAKTLEVQKGSTEPLVKEIKSNDPTKEDNDKKPTKKKRKTKPKEQPKQDCLKVTDYEPRPVIKSPVESMPLQILPNKTYRPKLTVTMPVIDENENSDARLALDVNKSNCPDRPGAPEPENDIPALLSPNNFGLLTVLSNSLVSASAESFFSSGSRKRSPQMSRDTERSDESKKSDSHNKTDAQNQQKISLVILNKRRNKLRDKKRKAILDSEKLQLYDRDENGSVIPALRHFKRKTFNAPSAREIHYRKKLMTELEVVKELESKRIETFFEKLDAEKGEIPDSKPYRIKPLVQEEPVKRLPSNVGLVSLEKIAAVYGRGRHSLPEGIEPGSFEAMRHCSYLRPHDFDEEDGDSQHGGRDGLKKKTFRSYSHPIS